jgi:biotin carboxyl carrier protein
MTLDGRILSVDVTAIAGRLALLIGPPVLRQVRGTPGSSRGEGGRHEASRRSYEVAVERRSNGGRIVYVNGLAIPVSIVDPRERLVRRRSSASADTGPRSIVSPMPGRIVKVLVRKGEVVAAQQGLVVVEAMKMENELRAPRAGQVSAVNVVEGMSVEGGAVLLVME